jgi:hypothetical protein
VFGVGSNFILNLKYAANGDTAPLIAQNGNADPARASIASVPIYAIEGPRGAYKQNTIYKSPIHVRRSTFRLPTNPKSPVIMVGPGTVCYFLKFAMDMFSILLFTGCCSFPWLRARARSSCSTDYREERT